MGSVLMELLVLSVKALLLLQVVQGAKLRLGGEESCFEEGIDYVGNDINEGHYVSTPTAAECQKTCQRTAACQYWTWDPTYHTACWMKTAKDQTTVNSKVTSGPKYCEGEQTEVAAAIGSDYAIAGSATAGHSIIYRTSVFDFEGHGVVNLNEMDVYGLRTVEYAHFTHKMSGVKVDHFNTHLCLCNGDQLLGSAKTIAQAMEEHRKPGSRVILTGDFNCDDGFENSKPVLYFKGQLENTPVPLDDTFRVFNGDGVDGTTFPGKTGKIDYLMVDKGAGVRNAWIDRNWDDVGKASDHWPVAAVVEF